jgi:hypothetical protein
MQEVITIFSILIITGFLQEIWIMFLTNGKRCCIFTKKKMKTKISLCLIISFLFFQNNFYSLSQTVLTLQPGTEDGVDAPFTSIYPDVNYGNDPSFLACAWTFGGEFGIDRSLLKFDLKQISPSAIIIDAKLSLYYWQGAATGHAGENGSLLQKIIENWEEMSVTWNNQPTTTTEDEVYLPASSYQTQNYPDIDITRFVSDWVADPQNNFGMLFRISDEWTYRSMLFASSDNPTASLRPKLVITYLQCPDPIADFSYIVEEPNVLFYDSSSSANTWFWDFGDGYFSDLRNPVHNYAQYGKYYTCLSITDSCGPAQYCDTVYYCRPPNPRFSYLVNGHFVSFTDSSVSPSSWYWSFGDNFFSDLQNPTHYYKNPGTYYVCLTSSNSCNQQTFCDSVVFQPNGVTTINGEEITIYPIPASDHLTLEWVNPKPGPGEIHVINARGSVILKKGTTITSGYFHDEIDIKELSPGFYILRMITGNATLLKRFIII